MRDSDVWTIYKDDPRYNYHWIDACDVWHCTFKNNDKLHAAVYGSDTQLTVNIVKLPDIDISPYLGALTHKLN